MRLPTWCAPARRTGRSPTSCSTAATSPARAWACPRRSPRGSRPGAYIYTDRPAYRPGQDVAVRGVVREVVDGQYANVPGAVYRFEVADSRGRLIVARPVTLSEFGTFHESLPLDAARPGRHVPRPALAARQERVRRQLRGPVVPARADRPGVRPDEDGLLPRRDGQGRPGRPVPVRRPRSRTGRSTCNCPTAGPSRADRRGRQVSLRVRDRGFAEEQALRLAAQLPQDNVGSRGGRHARRPRLPDRPEHDPRRLPRRRVLRLRSSPPDAQGEPIGQSLSVAVVKQVERNGRVTEREVEPPGARDRPEDGQGRGPAHGRGRRGRPLRPPRRRDRPVRQPDRRRAGS